MVEKKQLNVRIPVELAEKIDDDDKSKVEIIVEALKLYFDSKKQINNSNNNMSGTSNDSKGESSISTIDMIDSKRNNNDISDNSNAIKSDNNTSKINSIDSNYTKNDSSDNSNAIKSDNNTNKINSIDSNHTKNDSSDNNNAIKSGSSISRIDSIDSNGLERMKNEIEYLRSKVDDLLKLLHQEQVLHIQTQRMITAPETSNVMKKWWQFWR